MGSKIIPKLGQKETPEPIHRKQQRKGSRGLLLTIARFEEARQV
jgi:hypothetical protein